MGQIPATWLISGTAFHVAAEAWERSGRELTISEVQQAYRAAFDAEVARAEARGFPISQWLSGGRAGVHADLGKRRADGAEWIADYIGYALASPWKIWELPDGDPAVEVPFTLRVPIGDTITGVVGSTVEVIGFIDQILTLDGIVPLRVRDLKTSTKEPLGNRQLGIYGVAIEETFGYRIAEGDYFMARKGKASMPIPLANYTRQTLDTEFAGLEVAVNAGIFLASPGDNCRPCDVKHACPVFNMKG